MVASGTRNARAISAPVRPPTAWRVSATRASGASAGWQQVNSRARRSSPSSVRVSGNGSIGSAEPGSSGTPSCSSFCSAVRRWRIRSIARLRATVYSHAAGDCGVPSRAQISTAERERLLERVLGQFEVAQPGDERGEHARAVLAKRLLDGLGGRGLVTGRHRRNVT